MLPMMVPGANAVDMFLMEVSLDVLLKSVAEIEPYSVSSMIFCLRWSPMLLFKMVL